MSSVAIAEVRRASEEGRPEMLRPRTPHAAEASAKPLLRVTAALLHLCCRAPPLQIRRRPTHIEEEGDNAGGGASRGREGHPVSAVEKKGIHRASAAMRKGEPSGPCCSVAYSIAGNCTRPSSDTPRALLPPPARASLHPALVDPPPHA
jgi:hypothetical protein